MTCLAQNGHTSNSGDWNRSANLVGWRLSGNLLPLTKFSSFFPYNEIFHLLQVNFTAVHQGLVAFQQKKLGSKGSCFQTSHLKILAEAKARYYSKPKWIFRSMNIHLLRFCYDLCLNKLFIHRWHSADWNSISSSFLLHHTAYKLSLFRWLPALVFHYLWTTTFSSSFYKFLPSYVGNRK